MKNLIIINDTDKTGEVNVSFKQLLDAIDKIGEQYLWTILEFEATGNFGDDLNYSTIKNAIQNRVDGFTIAWEQLKKLASECEQVINLVLVAKTTTTSSESGSFQKLIMNHPIVISIEDGDYWEIYTDIPSVISNVTEVFNCASVQQCSE